MKDNQKCLCVQGVHPEHNILSNMNERNTIKVIHQRQALQSLCRESAIWDISCLSPCLCGINLPVIDPFCPWPRICFELWPCHSSREDINVQFHSFLRRIGESSIIWGADNNIYIVICSYTKYSIWITLRISPRRNHF